MTESTGVVEGGDAWIVGVDGSPSSRHAMLWAAGHARGRTSTLRLVSAWTLPAAPALPPLGPMHRYWDSASFERDARTALDRVTAELVRWRGTVGRDQESRLPGPLHIESLLAEGPSSAVLIHASRGGELVVVGARGRGGFARLVLGSTSTQCATHARVPTVVIPGEGPISPASRILVAIDGSDNSRAALRWAFDFAAPSTHIECLSVWEVSPTAAALSPTPRSEPEASDRLERLVGDVRSARSDPVDDSITVTCRVEQGDPRSELAAACPSADLVVMGARGHGPLSAVLLGSVSTWLLHHVNRPMVVVPDTSVET